MKVISEEVEAVIHTKECEICCGMFKTKHRQTKYCEECRKNPEMAKRQIEYSDERSRRHEISVNEPLTKTCKQCQNEFMTVYDRKFCCKECEKSHKIQTAKCEICGANLYSLGVVGETICSEKCLQVKEERAEKAKLAKAIDEGDYVACVNCGKMFIRKNYRNECCSNKCRLEAARKKKEKNEAQYEKMRAYNSMQIVSKCNNCGKSFIHQRNQKKYFCCNECANKNKKKERATAISAKKPDESVSLCIICKTSQAKCERFTSNFVHTPIGYKCKTVNKNMIVYECPKFS